MKSSKKLVGIEIGGTKLQLVLANSSGGIEQTVRHTVDPAGGAESIRTQISDGLKKLGHSEEIGALGVGFGGPVDWKTGAIRVSHQVSGWSDFNILEWLQKETKKPVALDNDANTAALAEALHGRGKGYERVFYMTIGSGIGGGMIINGKIYHGIEPGEVEVGHLRLNKQGDTLESKCSGWAVNRKVRAYIDQHPDSLLAQLSSNYPQPEATLLKPALERGDEAARKIMEEVSDDLAFALSHVVHLFHPDIIIMGGGLSLLKDYLRQPVIQKLPQYVMKAFLPLLPIEIASLGEQVVPIGALELAKRIAKH